MKKQLIFFPVLLIVMTLYSGCNNNSSKISETNSQPVEIRYPDKGDFILQYEQVQKPFYREVISEIEKYGLVRNIINDLNRMFILPYDIPITFVQKNDANAYYNPETKSIEFDLDFVDLIYDVFQQYYTQHEDLRRASLNTTVFLLLHEVGHALTDIYNLSVTGPEEDMVDNFSVFLLSNGNEEAEKALIDGANFFSGLYQIQGNPPATLRDYMDEHSMHLQRFYSILSLLYGKNPEMYQYFVDNGILPPETINRKERLMKDYEKNTESWRKELSSRLQGNE